jgi:hypothetical protein
MKAIDRSEILAESYAGVADAIVAHADAVGGWVCEEHPDRLWPHDDCPGPAMLPGGRLRVGAGVSG